MMKKTKFTWPCWLIYTISYLFFAYQGGFWLCELMAFDQDSGLSYVLSGEIVVLTVLLSIPVIAFFRKERTKEKKDKKTLFQTEEFLPIVGYLLVLGSRILYLHFNDLRLSGNVGIFESAKVGSKTVSLDIGFHGLAWFYQRMLRTFCLLFGNDVISLVALHLMLQLVTVILLYLALRMLFGKVTAIISSLAFAVIPQFMDAFADCNPGVLMVFFISIWLMLTAVVFREKNADNYLLKILYGLYCGFLCGLDLFLALFVVIAIIMILSLSENRIVAGLCWLGGNIVGVILSGFMLAKDAGSLFDYYEGFFTRYENSFDFSPNAFRMYDDSFIIAFVCMIVLTGMLCLVQKYTEQDCVRFLSPIALFVVIFKVSHLFLFDDYYVFAFVLVLFSSVSCGSILRITPKVQKVEEDETEIVAEASKEPQVSDTQEKKTRMIPNPLPVPKKHVHKEMDYLVYVPQHMMHYDVEVSDDDDFDLK